jgi:hypothetical protein
MDVSRNMNGTEKNGVASEEISRGSDGVAAGPSSAIEQYQFEPVGPELLETIVRLSGLDEKKARNELEGMLSSSGHEGVENLTIDDLRASMLQYLEEMNRTMVDSSAE